MALNITAEREVNLSGYGKGWDGCYLLVKSMNPKELDAWYKSLDQVEVDATLDSITSDLLRKVLRGGVIMNTPEGGVQERYTLKDEDLDDVVEQIDLSHKQVALRVAAGTQDLKGL